MNISQDYIKVCGDKAIIQINDSDGTPRGYYAGSIKPYCSCWEKAKFYQTKKSARQIAKTLSEKFTILMMSELIN